MQLRYSEKRAAQYLEISQSRLAFLRRAGRGPKHSKSCRRVRYLEEDLKLFKHVHSAALPSSLSTAEAARLLKATPQSLLNWRARHKGPAFERDGRKVRYTHSAIDAFRQTPEGIRHHVKTAHRERRDNHSAS